LLSSYNYGGTADTLLEFKFVKNWLFGQDYAAETSDLGAKYVNEVINFDGPEHIFPGSYKEIVNVLT